MEPISTTLAIITAGTSILGAFNQFKAGKEAQKAADYEASELERRARELKIRNEINKDLENRQLHKIIGAQKAAYAGSGIDVGSNSPLMAAEEAASELAMKQLLSDREIDFELSQMKSSAETYRQYGQAQKQTARLGAMSSMLQSSYALSKSLYKSPESKTYNAETQTRPSSGGLVMPNSSAKSLLSGG